MLSFQNSDSELYMQILELRHRLMKLAIESSLYSGLTSRSCRLLQLIIKKVKEGSTINTDEWHAYKGLSKKGYTHKTVDHSAKEYARGDMHVNSLEGYWARLKGSITGTHVHVSPKHLNKYTKEFEYRYNFRKNPERMFPALISTLPVNSS